MKHQQHLVDPVRTDRRSAAGLVLFVLSLLVLHPAVATRVRAEGGYVGSAVCTGCHAPIVDAYSKTIHARVLNEQNATSPRAARGCEACHGPGQRHVTGGGKGGGKDQVDSDWVVFGSTDPDLIQRENKTCLGCHAESTQRLPEGSPHESRDVGCVSCHDVMKQVSTQHLLSQSDQTTATAKLRVID